MAYTDAYFTLTWTTGVTAYSKRFRLLLADADPEGQLNLDGTRRDLAGVLNICAVSFEPKTLKGVAAIHPNEAAPYGTLAELKLAWQARALDLTCQRWADNAAWRAYWQGPWRAIPAEPCGQYWYAVVELEQVS